MTKTNTRLPTLHAAKRGAPSVLSGGDACSRVHESEVLAGGAHVEGGRQEINKQVGFNRIVPGAPRTGACTQAERISRHANTAKGKAKLIAETLRK